MIKKVAPFLLLLIIISCNFTVKKEIKSAKIKKQIPKIVRMDSSKLEINFKPKGDYKTIKNNIKSARDKFKKLYLVDEKKAVNDASNYLYNQILNEIVPFWYGTPWDFNGYTNTPNEGVIACGYFVSTTLKHVGMHLNRYKMAQQAGLNEAKLLQDKSKIKIFSNETFKSLKQKLNNVYADGLYFIGLDNHVGYVLIKNKEIYFLHASYYENRVMIELAEKSVCFRSNLYVFAEITTNKELVKKWIFNEDLM